MPLKPSPTKQVRLDLRQMRKKKGVINFNESITPFCLFIIMKNNFKHIKTKIDAIEVDVKSWNG